jgi:small subunit ribosomal protein S9
VLKNSSDLVKATLDSEALPSSSSKPAVKDSKGRVYATGKRKSSVARVWIKPGKGEFIVNGRSLDKYFDHLSALLDVLKPFACTNRDRQYDVWCTVKGGGFTGQSGAIRHGISRALLLTEPELRSLLKHEGFITRDPRRVERKKPGQPKARKSFQFSKR